MDRAMSVSIEQIIRSGATDDERLEPLGVQLPFSRDDIELLIEIADGDDVRAARFIVGCVRAMCRNAAAFYQLH